MKLLRFLASVILFMFLLIVWAVNVVAGIYCWAKDWPNRRKRKKLLLLDKEEIVRSLARGRLKHLRDRLDLGKDEKQ